VSHGRAAATITEARRLHREGRTADTMTLCRRILEKDSRNADAHLLLGTALFGSDPRAGLAHFERAHGLRPSDATARHCLSLGHVALGAASSAREEWAAAIASYRTAIAVEPDHAAAHFSLAIELLRQGAFDEGWREYEWRWRWGGFGDRPRGFAAPQWTGDALRGARVLLHAEQGLGDAIQFLRYVPRVAEQGGRVVLEVPRPLVRLAAALPGVDQVVARGDALPSVDRQCPLMSLPLAFGTTTETIPSTGPYLDAGTAAGGGTPGGAVGTRAVRVGLVWAGSPAHQRDERRSMPLSWFAPMMADPRFTWYSLQKGPHATDLHVCPEGVRLVDLGSRIGDFADSAACAAGLDLIISVDTSVAHLAGALGKPVWILVPKPSDWRWMTGRSDSPWYPTARLFRQHEPGDWAPVLEDVRRALADL
jgi:hypothetical protein